jgi:class 3 adenylate cyclase
LILTQKDLFSQPVLVACLFLAFELSQQTKINSETHEMVTVYFSDIVHFTDISRLLSPTKVCDMLDRLYLAFDELATKHGVFKVETIGDAWMGVTNCT